MRLSLNWLKDFVDYGKKSPQELAEVFTLLGHEVEKIEEPAKNLEKIYLGKILRIEKHPNADKLRIAETCIGSKIYKIVCGGTNLRAGMSVAVAMPGARVRWHGQGDLVELKETEIRGIKSAGMICASPEIGLETLFPTKEEKEIVDLSGLNLKDGDLLAPALQLGPVLYLDITPNRADCLSVMGLARELAAGLGLRSPQSGIPFVGQTQAINYSLSGVPQSGTKSKGRGRAQAIKITIENKAFCPKYTAQVFTNVKVGESPLWIKTRLWQAGVRPINNIVDATNYVMLETGEPTHAFDLDKLSQKQISDFRFQISEVLIRNAKKGEKIKALDGNTYELDETMLVVADSKRPVAIAGVMGGEETRVTAETKNILLEAAIFDPVSVRKTSRKLGLRSESSARFERGLAWPLPEIAQSRFSVILNSPQTGEKSLLETELRRTPQGAPATVGRKLGFDGLAGVSITAPKPIFITQTVSAINQMLNLKLTPARIKSILTLLGFTPSLLPPDGHRGGGLRWGSRHIVGQGEVRFRVQVPWWRLDIKIPEDLYEEVGRIHGLNKLAPTLPQGELALASRNSNRELAEATRDILLALGYDEVLSYSFYGRDTLGKDGSSLEREPHLQVANPINPNQELLRTNLTRNLLDAASRNARLFDEVKIFEIGKVFHPVRSRPAEGAATVALGRLASNGVHHTPTLVLPLKTGGGEEGVLSSNEQIHLAAVYTAKGTTEEEIFRKLKGDLEALIGKQKKIEFHEVYNEPESRVAPAAAVRAQGLDVYFDNIWVGWLGLLDEARRLSWKIKEPCALAEFNLDAVLASPEHSLKHKLIPEFPPVHRDIAFAIDEKINYDEVAKAIQGTDELVRSIELFDIFRGVNVGNNKKSLAFHITLQSYQKTLGDEETSAVMNKLTRLLKEKFNANVRE